MAINPKIKQKAEDIRKKIFGAEVRESLASGLEGMSEDVESIKGRQGNVEQQFQDVLDETTDKDFNSAPEIKAARNGKSNLKTRLDDEHAEVTAQLQQTANKVYGKHLTSQGVTNVVSFYIDDGQINDWNIIKPISEATGVPFTIASIPNAIDHWGDYAIPVSKLIQLQSMGWEINSHTYNHLDLTLLTEAEIEVQLKNSRDYFESHGLSCKSICYPYGNLNETVMKVARKYYRSGLGSEYKVNTAPINTYNLYRYNFDVDNLDGLKAKIDALDNEWAVIYLHSETWVGDKLQENTDKLNGLIAYVKGKQIPTLTVDKALDIFENKLDIGDDQTSGLRVGANGVVDIASIPSAFSGDNSGVTINTPVTHFDKYKITMTAFTKLENFGLTGYYPDSSFGTLLTYRPQLSDALSFQVMYLVDNSFILRRVWNIATNSWGDFKAISPFKTRREIYVDPVPPNGSVSYDYASPALRLNEPVALSFEGGLPTGLIHSASAVEEGHIKITIYNITTSQIPVGVKYVRIAQF